MKLLESSHQLVFMLREEMAITVEDNGHARVTGSRRDLLRVRSRCDPQRDGGVAQVVHAERGEISLVDGWVPEVAAEAGGADGMTLGDVKTRSSGSGGEAGTLESSSTTKPGTVTVRSAARVFGGPKLSWPARSVSVSTTVTCRRSMSTCCHRRARSSPMRRPP